MPPHHPNQLTGRRFGKWTVTSDSGKRQQRHVLWTCTCDCGTVADVNSSNLLLGASNSCGCTRSLGFRATHGHSRIGKRTSEHRIWAGIIQRCTNVNNPDYDHYGGRGISVCERWRLSFLDFLSDVGARPGKSMSIDRINNDGNYEPGNVRWATAIQQRNNQRRSAVRA